MVFSPESGYKFEVVPERSCTPEADPIWKLVFALYKVAETNDANLYSVKPLLTFDAGGMIDGRAGSPDTWLAAGGGLQIIIVTAKLEVGYMRTISGPTFGNRGNVFVRLVFQNLF